jgi:hypothetical protein
MSKSNMVDRYSHLLWWMLLILGVLLTIAGWARFAFAQSGPAPAVALDPITVILDAFRSHHVVALGEGTGHGDEQAYAFRLALIRDPRFVSTVNDIVVESGSARYQDVMDKFVQGEAIAERELRRVWQETTQPTAIADLSIYQDFFRAVRQLNARLPREHRLRVLLGDPPIDWDAVHTPEDFRRWLEQRDSFPAELIRREVIANNRRALVVYGQMHFQRRQVMSNYDMSSPLAQTMVSLLERDAPGSVFTIWPSTELEKLQTDVTHWPHPSLAIVRGTLLGAADFAAYRPAGEMRVTVQDGRLVPLPRDQWKVLRAEDQLDAVIYPGPKSSVTFSKPAASLCDNPDHVKIRLARIALASLPPSEAERLEKACK